MEKNDNLLKQIIEAENSRDVEKVLTLLTDDIVIEDVTFGVVMKGKDGFKQNLSHLYHGSSRFQARAKSLGH